MNNRTIEDGIREYIESYYHPNMINREWDDFAWEICVMVKDAMCQEGWKEPEEEE